MAFFDFLSMIAVGVVMISRNIGSVGVRYSGMTFVPWIVMVFMLCVYEA